MIIKKHLLIFISIIISQITISQNKKIDIVIFKNGSTKEGKVELNGIERATKNGTIELCDENYKNCKKYKRSNINEIIINADLSNVHDISKIGLDSKISKTIPGIVKYKVLFKKKSNRPLVSKLILEGEIYNYYMFESFSYTDSNTLNSFSAPIFIYLTKKDNNSIEYRFQHKTNKKTIQELRNIFKNCDELKVEAKKKKKAINDKSLSYFLNIADNCS